MAIKTVTNANLAEYVAERTAGGSKIATGEEQVAAADAAPASTDGSPTPGHPVIKAGIAETNSNAPDPGNAQPSAKGRKHDVENRMDELTRQRKEVEEFAEEEYAGRLRAEARIAALETELQQAKPKEVVKVEELVRPSPKNFETQEAYDAAMESYDSKRDERIRKEAVEQGRREAQQAASAAAMRAKIDAAKVNLPDYQDVIDAADARKAIIPNHVMGAIIESDFGVYLAYELAKDPTFEARIFKMTPAKALLELGKLEDKLETKYGTAKVIPTAAPTTETTRAPAPLTSVRGEGGGEIRTDLSKPMPFNEYKQKRLAENRARRR